ncbi:uncharacterized protein J3D65DRAFT_429772 [Phyllosticta citribraziliensis]|uniref:Uncharacterized protein n=1 Tax=Phyllosticta citribraziliensis TaxID=989973 RepID=A0ABR1LK80_9PEZI
MKHGTLVVGTVQVLRHVPKWYGAEHLRAAAARCNAVCCQRSFQKVAPLGNGALECGGGGSLQESEDRPDMVEQSTKTTTEKVAGRVCMRMLDSGSHGCWLSLRGEVESPRERRAKGPAVQRSAGGANDNRWSRCGMTRHKEAVQKDDRRWLARDRGGRPIFVRRRVLLFWRRRQRYEKRERERERERCIQRESRLVSSHQHHTPPTLSQVHLATHCTPSISHPPQRPRVDISSQRRRVPQSKASASFTSWR